MLQLHAVIIYITWRQAGPTVINLVTNDSLISALDLFIGYLFGAELHSWAQPAARRYVLYAIFAVALHIANIVTWWRLDEALWLLVAAAGLPCVAELIMGTVVYEQAYVAIVGPIGRLGTYLVCSLVAYCVNYLSITELGINPRLTNIIIREAFKDIDTGSTMRAAAAAAAISYAESLGSYYKWAASLGAHLGIIDGRRDHGDARTLLRHIVRHQQWALLYKPANLRILMRLGADGHGAYAHIRALWGRVELYAARFFAVWAITAISGGHHHVCALLLSLILLTAKTLHEGNINVARWVRRMLLRAAVTAVAIVADVPTPAMSVGVECIELMDNRLVTWWARKATAWVRRNYWKLYQENSYNITIVASTLAYHNAPYELPWPTYVASAALCVALSATPIITLSFFALGPLDGGPAHLACIAIVWYGVLNAKKMGSINYVKMSLNIFDNYAAPPAPEVRPPVAVLWDEATSGAPLRPTAPRAATLGRAGN